MERKVINGINHKLSEQKIKEKDKTNRKGEKGIKKKRQKEKVKETLRER